MTIKVIVNGALGKMGQLAAKTLENHLDFTLVATTDRRSDLAAIIKNKKIEVVVDFTTADSVLENTQTIIKAGARPVIGTTGLTQTQIHTLQKECAKLKRGGIIAPNFSIGAILMMQYAQKIARYFSEVEIIEMHHAGKLDSPSGTALHTAEMIAAGRCRPSASTKKTRETIPGARGAKYQQIPIHAVRLPGLVAHEQVIFGGVGETLTIRHDSIDRECFMPGVVLACQKVMELKELVYGLENILDNATLR